MSSVVASAPAVWPMPAYGVESTRPPRALTLGSLAVGLALLAVQVSWFAEQRPPSIPLDTAICALASVLLTALSARFAWGLADAAHQWRRAVRLVLAALGVLAFWRVYEWVAYDLAGVVSIDVIVAAHAGQPRKPEWFLFVLSLWLDAFQVGLVFMSCELWRRRDRLRVHLAAAQHERTRMTRSAIHAQLAAMQAQVEPSFLFDTLVDIESMYERTPVQAVALLDALIEFLRVALPRLRETGSTLDTEFALVQGYARVLALRDAESPHLALDAGHGAHDIVFPPMVLMPLVQRATGVWGATSLTLRSRSDAHGCLVELDLGCSLPLDVASTLEPLGVRLATLHDERARLDASTLDAQTARVSIWIPTSDA